MLIYFTKHAEDKFVILEKRGVTISKEKIIETLKNPDLVDKSRMPLLIAQSNLDRDRVLRVVYKQEEGFIKIITFYPGRKKQYEE
ncbi:MAG: DUF4258 domain-containing protein [bacterium]|nr:DUF4258 domain-containing protein [bacterium]